MVSTRVLIIRTQDPTVSTRVQMLNSINFYPAGVNPGFPPSGPDGVNPGPMTKLNSALGCQPRIPFQI